MASPLEIRNSLGSVMAETIFSYSAGAAAGVAAFSIWKWESHRYSMDNMALFQLIWKCKTTLTLPGVSCLGWLATIQLRATDSKSFWISGAQWTNSWVQNLKVGFLISSMKVMSKPQGWGLFTINLSNNTLKIEDVEKNIPQTRR